MARVSFKPRVRWRSGWAQSAQGLGWRCVICVSSSRAPVPAWGNCQLPGTQWSSLFARLDVRVWDGCLSSALHRRAHYLRCQANFCVFDTLYTYITLVLVELSATCGRATLPRSSARRGVTAQQGPSNSCTNSCDCETVTAARGASGLRQARQHLAIAPPARAFQKRCGAALSEPACDPPARRTRWPGRRCQRPPATG